MPAPGRNRQPAVPAEPRHGVGRVLADLARHPYQTIICRWNWKMAAISAVSRGLIFLVVNLSAGTDAAVRAMLLEVALRGSTSGFYAAITAAFRRAEPAWAGSLAAMGLLPVLVHSLEFAVHWAGGTPYVARSVAASALFTVFTTQLYLFVARRGVLIVGDGSGSIVDDVRRLPAALWEFACVVPRALRRDRNPERRLRVEIVRRSIDTTTRACRQIGAHVPPPVPELGYTDGDVHP